MICKTWKDDLSTRKRMIPANVHVFGNLYIRRSRYRHIALIHVQKSWSKRANHKLAILCIDASMCWPFPCSMITKARSTCFGIASQLDLTIMFLRRRKQDCDALSTMCRFPPASPDHWFLKVCQTAKQSDAINASNWILLTGNAKRSEETNDYRHCQWRFL